MPGSPRQLPFSTASDDEIKKLLGEYRIGLTVEEARKITGFLGRDPTVTEAVIWGIQGSEHCSYKSSRRFLKQFTTTGEHIILGPVEDSGIVAMTDGPAGKRWGVVVTHESHNHPSQIVPFEGAATGVGGTVRDVVCMGARVIGCMDMLRMGDLQSTESRSIAKEVARGIAGYGNPLGVPNLGGDTVFDSSYNSNCLVNAIALGIVREDEILHSYVPEEAAAVGYDILIVGKPTDRSGFGGAAFASISMEEEKKEQNSGAVQEPNPFLERHLLASSYALFDWLVAEKKLDKVSCKDLGAGGVVCASVEQVADRGFGAQIALDQVHTAIEGLPPEVIGCAETQERLCFICHPDLTAHILAHFNDVWDLPSVAENARASVIGKVTGDGMYRLTYNGNTVCEAKALDITCGLQYQRPTAPRTSERSEPPITEIANCELRMSNFSTTILDVFKAMLAHPNGASKSPLIRHYDKNIIGNTFIEAGEADAAVIAPLQDLQSYVHQGTHPGWELTESEKWTGVAVAADGNNRYGRISPYWQGLNAALEAMRNVAAVGASPRALTDCLNYGNPEIPDQLWALEEGTRGIAVVSQYAPVISGNVSLYNGKLDGSAIDPTAIVSCIGILSDARTAVNMQLKEANSDLYLVGTRKNECGGSLFYQVLEHLSGAPRDSMLGVYVPQPDCTEAMAQMHFVQRAIAAKHVLACHDCSDGGMLLALFEMTLPQRKIGGSLGISIDLDMLQSNLPTWTLLFSETGGFLIEAPKAAASSLQALATELNVALLNIGTTTPTADMQITRAKSNVFCSKTADLMQIWENGLLAHWG